MWEKNSRPNGHRFLPGSTNSPEPTVCSGGSLTRVSVGTRVIAETMKVRTCLVPLLAIGLAATCSATFTPPATSSDSLTPPSQSGWDRERVKVRRSLRSSEAPALDPTETQSPLRPAREWAASAIPEPGTWVFGCLMLATCAMVRHPVCARGVRFSRTD